MMDRSGHSERSDPDRSDVSAGTASGGRVGGIIVAAGRSSRMGRPKALISINGCEILGRLIATYRTAGLDPLVVVASGAAFAAARKAQAQTVRGVPSLPMIDSIARALDLLESSEAAIIQPVDAPFTDLEMIRALCSSPRVGSRVLVHQDTPGHPVLVDRARFADIQRRPQGGLREVLSTGPIERLDWPNARILADLDRPEDLGRWGIRAD